MVALWQLFVRTPGDGRTRTLHGIPPSGTVEDVMSKLHEKEGVPPEHQRLVFAGKQLDVAHSLSLYNVQNGCTLQLSVRGYGGGVPGLYAWVRKHVPSSISEVPAARVETREGQAAQKVPTDVRIERLYVDVNGLLHPACRGLEKGASASIVVDRLCRRLDEYVDELKPRKVLHLALDGVAPTPKLNQQRQRRFRMPDEAARYEKAYDQTMAEFKLKGLDMDEIGIVTVKKPFVTAQISPGTAFMECIENGLREYAQQWVNEDRTVVISPSTVVGEGEHKIMEHIRRTHDQCDGKMAIVGDDADLILLCLVSPAAQRLVLVRSPCGRERGSRLLCVKMLYEYFLAVFAPVLSVRADVSPERMLVDVVLLSCFLGNDFLPSLPGLTLGDNGLGLLLLVYVQHQVSANQPMPPYLCAGKPLRPLRPDPEQLHAFLHRLAGLEHAQPTLSRDAYQKGVEAYAKRAKSFFEAPPSPDFLAKWWRDAFTPEAAVERERASPDPKRRRLESARPGRTMGGADVGGLRVAHPPAPRSAVAPFAAAPVSGAMHSHDGHDAVHSSNTAAEALSLFPPVGPSRAAMQVTVLPEPYAKDMLPKEVYAAFWGKEQWIPTAFPRDRADWYVDLSSCPPPWHCTIVLPFVDVAAVEQRLNGPWREETTQQWLDKQRREGEDVIISAKKTSNSNSEKVSSVEMKKPADVLKRSLLAYFNAHVQYLLQDEELENIRKAKEKHPVQVGVVDWKRRYASEVVKQVKPVADHDRRVPETVAGAASEYMKMLEWVVGYYLGDNDLPLDWFYPHFYSPLLEDLIAVIRKQGISAGQSTSSKLEELPRVGRSTSDTGLVPSCTAGFLPPSLGADDRNAERVEFGPVFGLGAEVCKTLQPCWFGPLAGESDGGVMGMKEMAWRVRRLEPKVRSVIGEAGGEASLGAKPDLAKRRDEFGVLLADLLMHLEVDMARVQMVDRDGVWWLCVSHRLPTAADGAQIAEEVVAAVTKTTWHNSPIQAEVTAVRWALRHRTALLQGSRIVSGLQVRTITNGREKPQQGLINLRMPDGLARAALQAAHDVQVPVDEAKETQNMPTDLKGQRMYVTLDSRISDTSTGTLIDGVPTMWLVVPRDSVNKDGNAIEVQPQSLSVDQTVNVVSQNATVDQNAKKTAFVEATSFGPRRLILVDDVQATMMQQVLNRSKVVLMDGRKVEEGPTVELKTGPIKPELLAKQICAFANSGGGEVLWGVKDEGITAEGVEGADEDEKLCLAAFSKQCKDALKRVKPAPRVSVQIYKVPGYKKKAGENDFYVVQVLVEALEQYPFCVTDAVTEQHTRPRAMHRVLTAVRDVPRAVLRDRFLQWAASSQATGPPSPSKRVRPTPSVLSTGHVRSGSTLGQRWKLSGWPKGGEPDVGKVKQWLQKALSCSADRITVSPNTKRGKSDHQRSKFGTRTGRPKFDGSFLVTLPSEVVVPEGPLDATGSGAAAVAMKRAGQAPCVGNENGAPPPAPPPPAESATPVEYAT